MNLRTFKRNYDVDLIAGAMENLTLGKCVYDSGMFGQPKLAHAGMPNYIFNPFVAKGLLSVADSDIILDKLRAIPLVEAAFAQINIEFESEDAVELNIPETIELKASFDVKKIKKYSISNSKGREIPNIMRLQIDALLDKLKDNHWDEYRSNLRKAYMITQLYYGSVSVTIDSEMEGEFETSLESQANISAKMKLDHSVSYTFENSKVPFAMRIERIKHWDA